MEMETAELDSHKDLGINAQPKDRLKFRKMLTCSPIAWQGHNRAYYGPSCDPNSENCTASQAYDFGSADGDQNYTYLYNPGTIKQNVGYALNSFLSYTGGSSVWTPIPELVRTDGDTSLFLFTANSVEYRNQVLDPFFLARYNDTLSGLYQPSYPVSAMSCVDQYVIQNEVANLTTPPSGIKALHGAVYQLNLSDAQLVVAQRLLTYFEWTFTYASVYSTGSNSLKASDRVLGLISQGVPPEYWRIEVEGWFETGLSKLQACVVEYADVNADLGDGGIVKFLLLNATSNVE